MNKQTKDRAAAATANQRKNKRQGKLTQYNAIYCGLHPVKIPKNKNVETMQVECVMHVQ